MTTAHIYNMMTPQTFRAHSYWTQDPIDPDLLPVAKQTVTETPEEKLKHFLEDWSFRIQSCADEASDEQLRPLESELLDLRDEMVYVLHQNLLS